MSNVETSISKLAGLLDSVEGDFNKILQKNSKITFHSEKEFVLQYARKNSYLLGSIEKDYNSLLHSFKSLAANNISLNPAKKHAYLLPRDSKAVIDITAQGLMHLAVKSGIEFISCDVVREKDTYVDQATQIKDKGIIAFKSPPIHIKFTSPFAKESERGKVIGAYCFAMSKNGYVYCYEMTLEDIEKIRSKSSSYTSKPSQSPWTTHAIEMYKKTCIKKASKDWQLDDTDDALSLYGAMDMDSEYKETDEDSDDKLVESVEVAKEPIATEEQKNECHKLMQNLLEKQGLDIDLYLNENEINAELNGYTYPQLRIIYNNLIAYLESIPKADTPIEASETVAEV